jgi:hypothetical protein
MINGIPRHDGGSTAINGDRDFGFICLRNCLSVWIPGLPCPVWINLSLEFDPSYPGGGQFLSLAMEQFLTCLSMVQDDTSGDLRNHPAHDQDHDQHHHRDGARSAASVVMGEVSATG